MRKAFLGVVALNLFALGAFAADTTTQAIEKRTGEFVAAWNRHDSKAMAGLFLPDGDLINPFGRLAKGRDEVARLFADEQSTVMKATTMKTDAITVRTLAPDVALADWDITVTGMTAPDGSVMPAVKFHGAFVWAKKGGTWSVMAARPMLPASPPGTAPR